MTADAVLAGTIGVLFAVGVYLMVSRNMIKVLLGFLAVGHGTNLLLLASGTWGAAPILGEAGGPAGEADPLPQAFVLTSIVITLAVCCFLLAMVYVGYLNTRHAEVPDDPDDRLADPEPGGAE